MKKRLYIERLAITVLLLLLLALAPAKAQMVVYTGQTSTLEVEPVKDEIYVWELYSDPSVNFATTDGDASPTSYAEFVGAYENVPSVEVLWKLPGFYFFKVTAWNASGCTNNIKIGIIEVKVSARAEIMPITNPICAGDPMTLELVLTGTAPWNFTYTAEDVNGVVTEYEVENVLTSPHFITIDPGPLTETSFTVISISDAFGSNTEPSNTETQVVNPLPEPSVIFHR